MTHKPSPSQLRRFGFTVGTGLAIIGFLSWYSSYSPAIPVVLWTIAGTLSLVGMVVPRLLVPVQRVWMAFALALGWVNTRIILGVLFYAVCTPFGVVRRVFHDPLDRQLQDGCVSYWVRREPQSFDPKAYERQF